MTSAPPPAPPPPLPPPMEPPSWPPPPHGPWPVRPQLRRSRTDKILGGVNGGLADYSGIDALLWRVGFVALTLAGGAGIVVYLLLWVLMPAGPPAVPGVPGAALEKTPARPRSPVPGVTIAALLIVVGLLSLITHLGNWDIGARGFLGSALIVVGLGLVAAAFTGGRTARGGLIAVGVVLSFALIVASSGPWNGTSGGVGERTYRPSTASEVRPLYEIGVGELTVDLTDVDLSDVDDPIRTRIDHGIGDLNVLVPRSADVIVRVDQGVGDSRVFGGGADDGRLVPGTGSAAWTDDGRAEFVITVDMGIGDAEVSRG
jgi:phage shock protein PspC (stress-responsive transcriptional regulator)